MYYSPLGFLVGIVLFLPSYVSPPFPTYVYTPLMPPLPYPSLILARNMTLIPYTLVFQEGPMCRHEVPYLYTRTLGFLIWRHQRDQNSFSPSVSISAGHHLLKNLKTPPSGKANQLNCLGWSAENHNGNPQQLSQNRTSGSCTSWMGPHNLGRLLGMPGLPLCHVGPKREAVIGQGSGSTGQLPSSLKAVSDLDEVWDYLTDGVGRNLTAGNNIGIPTNPEMPTFFLGRLQGPPLVTMVPEEPDQQIALTLPGTQNPLKDHPLTMESALPLSGTRIDSWEKQCWCWFAHTGIGFRDWKSWFPALGYGPCPGEWRVPRTPQTRSLIQPPMGGFWWSDSWTIPCCY